MGLGGLPSRASPWPLLGRGGATLAREGWWTPEAEDGSSSSPIWMYVSVTGVLVCWMLYHHARVA